MDPDLHLARARWAPVERAERDLVEDAGGRQLHALRHHRRGARGRRPGQPGRVAGAATERHLGLAVGGRQLVHELAGTRGGRRRVEVDEGAAELGVLERDRPSEAPQRRLAGVGCGAEERLRAACHEPDPGHRHASPEQSLHEQQRAAGPLLDGGLERARPAIEAPQVDHAVPAAVRRLVRQPRDVDGVGVRLDDADDVAPRHQQLRDLAADAGAVGEDQPRSGLGRCRCGVRGAGDEQRLE